MSNKTITHEVKLQKSVIVILGIMAFGLCANVFAPMLKVEKALAQAGQWVGVCHVVENRCADIVPSRYGDALVVKVAN